MITIYSFILLASAYIASGQRPSFAGSRPIGFPELLNKTTTPSGLQDKFGEGTTQRLPIEAQGDRDLVDRLSKLPIDKQPFWFINWQALEAQREKPETYPQRPNPFIDGNQENANGVPQTQNSGFVNPSVVLPNVNSGVSNIVPGNLNPGSVAQPPSVKVQNAGTVAVNPNKGDSNVDNRYGTETSTKGFTGSSYVKSVTANSDINKPSSKTGSTNSDTKKKDSAPDSEEDEFKDIEVKKIHKNN